MLFVVIKSIIGAIIGGIIGFIAIFPGLFVLWIVVYIVDKIAPEFYSILNQYSNGDPFTFVSWFVPAGAIIGISIPIIEEAKRRKEKAIEEAKRQEELDRQKRLAAERAKAALNEECASLAALLHSSKTQFLSLAELVSAANAHLYRAEEEFAEGAFAPFWDEVEHATNKLAAYHDGVHHIDQNARNYRDRASMLTIGSPGISIPKFAMPKGKLPDARPVAARLSRIVRQAQKDFHFASIYEQRKTNKILYAGFGTLASAILQMGDAIIDSLRDLSNSLQMSLDELVVATRSQTEILRSLNEQTTADAAARREDTAARREFEQELLDGEKKQREMLDNIQRGQKPWP